MPISSTQRYMCLTLIRVPSIRACPPHTPGVWTIIADQSEPGDTVVGIGVVGTVAMVPFYTNFVTPGTATGAYFSGPHSYLGGDRSSFEVIAMSQVIFCPV